MKTLREMMELCEYSSIVWPSDLINDLISWQEYADHYDIWDNNRHGWQEKLINFMKNNPHKTEGILYRTTVISDYAANKLRNKKPATLKKSKSLLESWSKTLDGANQYFQQREFRSYAIMAFPASQLEIVCDIDQVPFPNNIYKEDGEVLVRAKDRILNWSNITDLLVSNYGTSKEEEYIRIRGA